MRFIFVFSLLLIICPFGLLAQIIDKEDIESKFLKENNVLEEIVEGTDVEEFDINTAFEYLEYYLDKPLNLNRADEEAFLELGFLSDLDIAAIIRYRNQYGDFLAVSELQSVSLLSMEKVKLLSNFVKVNAGEDDIQTSIPRMMSTGKNELFNRWSRTFPDKKGFLIQDTTKSRFLGDQNQFYVRFKHSFERNLSYGFTVEKDQGEEFFKGSNAKTGFDFISAHWYLRNYRKWMPAIALGDYSVSIGQGLVHYMGFAPGKSSFTTAIKRSGRRLRAFTSVNEALFLRGGAIELKPLDRLSVLLFASSKQVDGNRIINPLDTTEVDDFTEFTSFQLSGLHRTPSEIEDKGSIRRTTAGGSVGLSGRAWKVNFNAVYDEFDKTVAMSSKTYQRFNFTGNQLLGLSLDYSYLWRNFQIFGETARSDNGAIATLNGLMFSADKDLDISVLYRRFPRDYQNLNSSVFSETGLAQNEQGIYLGLEYRHSREIRVNAYLDNWSHPWLRFGIDAPSKGSEQFVRVTYYKKRKYEFYIQGRHELKQRNLPTAVEEQPFDVLGWQRRAQLRLNFSHKITKTLELRNRVELSHYDIDGLERSRGYLIYQDVIYRPKDIPLSFTARYALFDTDDYNSRIYAFENDVLYFFSIPAYFNQGSRFYINLRYRPTNALTLEFRYAVTNYSNQDVISSGLNEIQGDQKHDLRAQIKFKF